jgi:hypothetical protein
MMVMADGGGVWVRFGVVPIGVRARVCAVLHVLIYFCFLYFVFAVCFYLPRPSGRRKNNIQHGRLTKK